MKKLLFLNFLLFWSPFLWAKDLTAKEALKIMNETQRAQLPHLLRQSQQEKFLKACGDQSFKSDENLFYQYCEAFIASDLCKDVSPEKRMNCNDDLKASVTHAPENVWNCMKGVGLGIKDIIVVLGKILEGIFTFITSPIDSTKKGAKIASAGLGQLQNYVSTEHMRQLQIINKENPPPDSRNNKRRASAAVEEIILSNLIDNVFNFLGEKNTAFACYNDENKWKRSCQLITNIVSIVAGGAIAGKGIHSAAQWFMRPKPGTKLPSDALKKVRKTNVKNLSAAKKSSIIETNKADFIEIAKDPYNWELQNKTFSAIAKKTGLSTMDIHDLYKLEKEYIESLARRAAVAPLLKTHKKDFVDFRQAQIAADEATEALELVKIRAANAQDHVDEIKDYIKYIDEGGPINDPVKRLKDVQESWKDLRQAQEVQKRASSSLKDFEKISIAKIQQLDTKTKALAKKTGLSKGTIEALTETDLPDIDIVDKKLLSNIKRNEIHQERLNRLEDLDSDAIAARGSSWGRNLNRLEQADLQLKEAKLKLEQIKTTRTEQKIVLANTTNPSLRAKIKNDLNKSADELRAAKEAEAKAAAKYKRVEKDPKNYEIDEN